MGALLILCKALRNCLFVANVLKYRGFNYSQFALAKINLDLDSFTDYIIHREGRLKMLSTWISYFNILVQ